MLKFNLYFYDKRTYGDIYHNFIDKTRKIKDNQILNNDLICNNIK